MATTLLKTASKAENQSILNVSGAEKAKILKEFQTLPGVGKSISHDLYDLGYRSLPEFKTAEPIMMYERLCMQAGAHLDRCLLYTFKCVVYAARTKNPDPEKMKWWYWKDKEL